MLPVEIAQDLQHFLRVLHSRYGEALVSVVLFGSWARGEARAESDIDLLVISKHFPRSRLDRHMDMFEAVKAVHEGFRLEGLDHSPERPRRPARRNLFIWAWSRRMSCSRASKLALCRCAAFELKTLKPSVRSGEALRFQ